MPLLALVALLLTASVAAAQPEQVVLFPGQTGATLRASLVADYKPASVLSEAAGKDRMYDTVWATEVEGEEGVVGVYTGFFVPFDCQPSCDPSQDVFNAGSENTQGINQEHVWPRAEGAGSGNAERDLHHLAPTFVRANADRGTLPFAEIDDVQTDDWYIENTVTGTRPTENLDAYSERNRGTAFEPREGFKGDVARAMVYFYTMYEAQADDAFWAQQHDTFLRWHELDRTDQAEYDRTFVIAGFQGDRPNPFVLDSTLVRRAFFPPIVSTEAAVPEGGFSLSPASPNPFASATRFTLTVGRPQPVRVEVFDVLGRRMALLHDGPVSAGAPLRLRLEAGTLPPGLYLYRATGETVQATRRVTLAR
ncbi:MAG: endonuclease [Bacteroidota bacterium]